MENIKVVVRFRPQNKKEENKDDMCLNIDTENNTVHLTEHTREHNFIFDKVFDGNSSQEMLYCSVAKNLVEWVCKGYNSTIFAYGNTGSGKTYTMFGSFDSQRGIIPRACEGLFQIINSSQDVIEAAMKCSFIEIYREHIRDLLAIHSVISTPSPAGNLRIRQNNIKGVYVQGALEKYVYTAEDILNIIGEGVLQRATASTALNSVSSRSHAVLTLTLAQITEDGVEIISKLNLVDLAGSENVGKSEAHGTTLIEAQKINKSLSCLANVIFALTEKEREHIPYRDSKLTFLLQDSLGGNSKTVIIATASPSVLSYSETVNTLKFAHRAKEIKNVPKVNRNESNANLLKTIDTLNKKISELESKLEDSKIIIQAVEQTKEENKENVLLRTRCERMDRTIGLLRLETDKEAQRREEAGKIFEKQRNLCQLTAQNLYRAKMENYSFSCLIDRYRLLCKSLKEIVDKPEILHMATTRIPEELI